MSSARIRRNTLYRALSLQLHGVVPCWICGQHMASQDATLEHIKPRSLGGTLRYENVVLTHSKCNNDRHNARPVAAGDAAGSSAASASEAD
jgi:5-methylcytosine-specific restriction endonuclease McrA